MSNRELLLLENALADIRSHSLPAAYVKAKYDKGAYTFSWFPVPSDEPVRDRLTITKTRYDNEVSAIVELCLADVANVESNRLFHCIDEIIWKLKGML